MDLIAAAKSGDQTKFSRADAAWDRNAADIASFLAGANPNWPEKDVADLLGNAWRSADVELVAINSNNASLSPSDTFAQMVDRSTTRVYNFAYLKDEDGAVARSYGAVCTPHAFVLDSRRDIVYHGRIDDSRMGNTITSRDLENAVADVVAGRPVAVGETEPVGCAIVW